MGRVSIRPLLKLPAVENCYDSDYKSQSMLIVKFMMWYDVGSRSYTALS